MHLQDSNYTMMGIHVDLTTSQSPSPSELLITNIKNTGKVPEREEGEIIEDEFEDISSDEELSMRKRIEELEARNAELEKIANISGLYNYELSTKKDVNFSNERNPLATIDLSDIDDYPPKNQQTKYKQPSNQQQRFSQFKSATSKFPTFQALISSKPLPSSTHRGHYRSAQNRNRGRRQSSSPEIISGTQSPLKHRVRKQRSRKRSSSQKRKSNKTIQNIKKSIVYEDLSSSDNNDLCYLNRDELRLALKRDNCSVNNSSSLNRKLMGIADNIKSIEPSNKVTSLVLPEVISKEITPTNQSSDDSVSLEEQELRLIALKSAVVKKHLARKKRKENDEKKPYSPSDFNDIKITPSPKNCDNSETCMDISPIASPDLILNDNDENTTPIDMDLANSSDSDAPIFIGQNIWMPNQQTPLPNSLNTIDSNSIIIHSPQPRKLLGNLETQAFIDSLNSTCSSQAIQSEIMDIDNDSYINEKISINSPLIPNVEHTDEEEIALRALLLAKMSLPKVIKKNSLITKENTSMNKNSILLNQHSNQISENFNKIENDVEDLRSSVLKSMKPYCKNTASVLKKAVRRLKNASIEISSDENINCDPYINTCNDESTKSLPDHINIVNTSFLPVINSPCLVNIDNSVYGYSNININQPKQNLFSPFYEHSFQPINIPNNQLNNISLRPALKVVPITNSTKCPSKLNKSVKVSKLKEDIIKKLKKQQTISPNLKEITLVDMIPIESEADNTTLIGDSKLLAEKTNVTETTLFNEKIKSTAIESEKPNILQNNLKNSNSSPIDKKLTENLNSIKLENVIEKPKQTEQSIEIERKIASLQKLSNSIQQTTEISIPLAKKPDIPTITKNLSPQLSNTKKIVKINKIINQTATSTLKRKLISKIQTENLLKKQQVVIQSSTNSKTNIIDEADRLVTNTEPPKVKKIIINVGCSSTESDDDLENKEINKSITNSNCLETEYSQNTSPMSVQIESPYSPNVSAFDSASQSFTSNDLEKHDKHLNEKFMLKEKISENNVQQKLVPNLIGKSVINDLFQVKLDEFLKNARTKVDIIKKDDVPVQQTKTIVTETAITPLAVRHLPQSSQLEYRRLVSRMKILEKQKQAKKINEPPITNYQVTITNETALEMHEESKPLVSIKKTIINDVAESLMRTVLITKNSTINLNKNEPKSVTNNSITISTTNSNSESLIELTENDKAKKLDLLQRYESAFHNNGNHILDNIRKALVLVNEGKEEKIKKILLQQRLDELREETEKCKNELMERNEKITKIYPAIINANKIITNLKSQRSKLNKAAKNLGKTLSGENYSLKEEKCNEILQDYKNLTSDIKLLKNFNLNDIKKRINSIQTHEEFLKNINKIYQEEFKQILKKNHHNNCTESNLKNNLPQNCNDDPIIEHKNVITSESKNLINKNDDDFINVITKSSITEENAHNTTTLDNSLGTTILYESIFETMRLQLNQNVRPKLMRFRNVYMTPLDYREEDRHVIINPFGILCPYQLMGQCDDKDCKYEHLEILKSFNDDIIRKSKKTIATPCT